MAPSVPPPKLGKKGWEFGAGLKTWQHSKAGRHGLFEICLRHHFDTRRRWPQTAGGQHAGDGGIGAAEQGFHRAIGAVADPAVETTPHRFAARPVAIADALDETGDAYEDRAGHARKGLLGLVGRG